MSRQQKRQGQREYFKKDSEVKRSCEKQTNSLKKKYLAGDAEEAAGKEDIKTVYNITRKLSGHTRTMTAQLETILEAC